MGLDSVELVMKFEKHFNIRIPDKEAEQIYTVQNIVDCVAAHRNITDASAPLQKEVFDEVCSFIHAQTGNSYDVQLKDLASAYFTTEDKTVWDKLESFLELDVPRPFAITPPSNGFLRSILTAVKWEATYNWQTITMMHFVDSVCANNYRDLVDARYIQNQHEIYISIMGITADAMGFEVYEISAEKAFVKDLGID